MFAPSPGFLIEDYPMIAAYSDEDYNGPKKMCPCQTSNWKYDEDNVSVILHVTCSQANCLCQYHTHH